MRELIQRRVRQALQQVGARMTSRQLERVKSVHGYLALGHWISTVADGRPAATATRFDLFAEALRHVEGTSPVYLEFGVYRGESLRWWSENLGAPDAKLVGFDSFEGLPENWGPATQKGHFDTHGRIPEVSDDRVSFVVGWFDDTLPSYVLPPHDQLVVNVDADLYSSAVLVLSTLADHLVPGTLIYFDELHDMEHELRAFREHLQATGKSVRPLAMADGGKQWLFQYT